MSATNTPTAPLDLEVRHLRLVVAVHEEGNLTRAGERLHLTQSALSHQLLDVEQRLGAPLFHRIGRRMVLTEAGERILRTARRVLDELHRTEEDIREISEGRTGTIRLTTECYTCYHWLPRLLEEFRAKHPGIDVRIDVGATDAPIQALLDGSIDLAIVSADLDDPRLGIEPLFSDELLVIVGPEHGLAARKTISPEDLASQNIFVYADPDESVAQQKILRPAGLDAREMTTVPLTEATIELVRAGLGVTVLARWAVQPYLDAGLVIGLRIGRAGLKREWKAATLARTARPAHLDDFIQLLGRAGPRVAGLAGLGGAPRRPRRA